MVNMMSAALAQSCVSPCCLDESEPIWEENKQKKKHSNLSKCHQFNR